MKVVSDFEKEKIIQTIDNKSVILFWSNGFKNLSAHIKIGAHTKIMRILFNKICYENISIDTSIQHATIIDFIELCKEKTVPTIFLFVIYIFESKTLSVLANSVMDEKVNMDIDFCKSKIHKFERIFNEKELFEKFKKEVEKVTFTEYKMAE